MNYLRITPENVLDFPKGTKVQFCYGAMYPLVDGVVTNFSIDGDVARLWAVTEDGDVKDITMFQDKGIGTYLIEVAERPKVTNPSGWAIYA